MRPKIFLGWAIAAIVGAVAAVAVALGQPAIATVNLNTEQAFPALRSKPNDVSKVTVTTADGSFSLVRGKSGEWTAPDKFGYPADDKKVRELIVTMRDMKLIEPKTTRPDRFARLDVEDVTGKGAKSRKVRLETASGEVLAEAIVGKNRYRLTGLQDSGTYIRLAKGKRAWLASGKLSVGKTLADWLDREVVNLASDSVGRVDISPQGAQAYSVERPNKDTPFQLEPVPDGRSVNKELIPPLASALAYVEFDDVKPRTDLALPAERHRAKVTTFDGVEVSVEVAKVGKADWAVFSARYAGDPAADTDAAKAARERAEKIDRRVRDWAYQIPEHVAKRLSKPIEEYLVSQKKTS